MIPIRDENPTRTRPVVVWVLIALNVALFLFEWSLGPEGFQAFTFLWGVIPARLLSGYDVLAWITPLTSMFMHGGWMHIIGNMWFLFVFGDNVEDEVGRGRFVLFYLLCGLAAVAAQVAMDPTSRVPMVGASGAIAGVLAGYVRLHPRARVLTLIPIFIFIQFVYLPAFLFIFIWFGLQLLSGVVSIGTIGQDVGGTAFFAHIGGFVAGYLLIPLFRQASGPTGRGRPPVVLRRREEVARSTGRPPPWRDDPRGGWMN
ncbi:MAG: rhomboid family intramembrane serine protease [Sandaracinaceae bacterium]